MVFLDAKCGDHVIIASDQDVMTDWWVGQIISRLGNSIDPSINSLFQVVDVDTGNVKVINADCVRAIL